MHECRTEGMVTMMEMASFSKEKIEFNSFIIFPSTFINTKFNFVNYLNSKSTLSSVRKFSVKIKIDLIKFLHEA